MSNPTSNFGWQMPTPTDLVTDLPADFEVFGQAVDSTMADLKGGTSGQILSKNSNTDMDFVWITNDQGDITGVTAGTGLTGGGTSGAVTLTLDQANYGNGINAAGRNKVINGAFDIWQRGTSSFTNGGLTADRWYYYADGTGTRAVTQQTFTSGTAPVSGYEGQYFWRMTQSVAGTGGSLNITWQRIEDVRTFAGQTVTMSFWAKADAARTISVGLNQNFGSGGSTAVSITGTNFSATTSWQRFSYTVAIPSIAGKTIGTSSYFEIQIGMPLNVVQTIDIWGVQLEAGSTATPFSRNASSIQGELAACQRYYQRITADAIAVYKTFSTGWAASTTAGIGYFYSPVTMRVTPTSIDYSTLQWADGANAGVAVTGVAVNTNFCGSQVIAVDATVASGLTQYRPYMLRAANSSTAYLGFSAEL